MKTLTTLIARRMKIADEIKDIKSMRKGSLSSKYQKVTHKNGETVEKGPYYVLTKKASGGKTISQPIPAADAPYVQDEVDNYKKFRQLSDEYIEVCEEISILTNKDGDEGKKN
jgi:hypothetical protein